MSASSNTRTRHDLPLFPLQWCYFSHSTSTLAVVCPSCRAGWKGCFTFYRRPLLGGCCMQRQARIETCEASVSWQHHDDA